MDIFACPGTISSRPESDEAAERDLGLRSTRPKHKQLKRRTRASVVLALSVAVAAGVTLRGGTEQGSSVHTAHDLRSADSTPGTSASLRGARAVETGVCMEPDAPVLLVAEGEALARLIARPPGVAHHVSADGSVVTWSGPRGRVHAMHDRESGEIVAWTLLRDDPLSALPDPTPLDHDRAIEQLQEQLLEIVS